MAAEFLESKYRIIYVLDQPAERVNNFDVHYQRVKDKMEERATENIIIATHARSLHESSLRVANQFKNGSTPVDYKIDYNKEASYRGMRA